MKEKVLVAMSGGVDSSVAAYLLLKQGYDVSGITMCLGVEVKDEDKIRCCGAEAINDAKQVCQKLSISHYVFDYSQELSDNVIDPFISEYVLGRTPNPCVECNRSLKFGSLLQKTLAMGFSYLATGHYAALKQQSGEWFLKKPYDRKKDQTYFLYAIRKESLSQILFPLASYTKEQVREIAREAQLPVHNKPQSQDICFIPDGDYRGFIKKRGIQGSPGDIVLTSDVVLGKHSGLLNFTIGQREGLGIGYSEPLYVLKIDIENNRLIVGTRQELYSLGLIAEKVNYFTDSFPEEISAKIRYAHVPAKCIVKKQASSFEVVFNEPQSAPTPGQSVVLYDEDIVLGGGIIASIIN